LNTTNKWLGNQWQWYTLIKMKKLFYLGLIGLTLFEVSNVYFIMPMPGSQDMKSLDLAYFLFTWRWLFRILFASILVIGFAKASWNKKWLPILCLVIFCAASYFINFQMAADHMFYQPKSLLLKASSENKVDSNRLVIGVVINNQAKAYPIQFIGYHHLVMDSIDGKPILVTYCTVCRTGRIFEPLVNGHVAEFRLVGMDHFNAMFEDVATKSWWRQATGEAVTGPLKGQQLPEILSTQTSLESWLKLYPQSLVMQADPAFQNNYDSTLKYESGKSKKKLTGTDSLSWNRKSWVVGITVGNSSKAYDWNRLVAERLITDSLGGKKIYLLIGKNNQGFFAFEKDQSNGQVDKKADELYGPTYQYLLSAKAIDSTTRIKQIMAHQEFWHSWKTFHPNTGKY
jgi:hypothetical protein